MNMNYKRNSTTAIISIIIMDEKIIFARFYLNISI